MISRKDRAIPTWYKQLNFEAFRELYSREGQFPLLFVGSGVSIRAGLPNWRDLLLGLAGHHDAIAPGRRILPDVATRLDSALPDQTEYYETGSFVEQALTNDLSKDGWRQALNHLLDPPELRQKESLIHSTIARLRWRRIITTNYDVLLEHAVKIHNPQREVNVAYPGTNAFLDSMEHDNEDYILKIHGDIADPRSPLILSRKSFEELYRRDNDDYRQVMNTLLNSSSVILFIGYSHEDQYVRQLFNDELYRKFRPKIFTLVPREGRGSEFDARLQTLTTDLKIRFITYSPDDEHQELLEFLDYFADTNASEYDILYSELATIRTPTVIMLHCGGTIGSESAELTDTVAQQLGVVRKNSRYDGGLRAFSDKLLSWYQDSYNTGDAFRPEILWEILPPDEQMFSEDATPALWNKLTDKIERLIYKYFEAPVVHKAGAYSTEPLLRDLYDEEYDQYSLCPETDDTELTEKRFRRDFTNRYIMGIVVLFGTDTMSFAASSLGLSIQHLPCPVIITGANHPPEETTGGQFHATSDAWANLMSSLYFLQCFGHRLTEVLVCFGGTIHNSANLRKRATEIIPSGRPGMVTRYTEPFSFRNLSLRGQYMFKLIDGIFCNNYYPNPVKYAEMVSGETNEFENLRHIRFDALRDVPRQKAQGQDFSERVVYLEVTPCFPPIDVELLQKRGIAAALVQGYPSGTYPANPANTFTKFLRDAYAAGIPVVLVSEYGTLASQQVYSTSDRHVFPWYEIVTETALPLLSLIVSAVPAEAWNAAGEPADVIRRRIQLLRAGVHDIFHDRPNILSKELEFVADKERMYKDLVKVQEGKSEQRHEQRGTAESKWSRFPQQQKLQVLLEGREQDYAEGFAMLARSDLLALLNALPTVFEKVEAGPDGLEALFNMGFGIGLRMWESIKKNSASSQDWRDDQPPYASVDQFFELAAAPQEKRRLRAYEVAARICEIVELAGLAEASSPDIAIKPRRRDREAAGSGPGSFSLTVKFNRYEAGEGGDERYAVMTFSDEEREFFRRLRDGCGSGEGVERYSNELDDLYKRLLRTTWRQATRTIDWLLLGLFKGVACGITNLLGIDSKSTQDLRKRMKSKVVSIEEGHLTIAYEYFE